MNKTNSDAFLDTLTEIDGGLFLQEIGDKLAEVVKACSQRGKKGGLQISLGLKPNSRGQVEVVARVESALPKSDSFGAIFFGTEQGLLQRRDPRQPELPGIDEEAPPTGKKLRVLGGAAS
jgi:hypothetical protein